MKIFTGNVFKVTLLALFAVLTSLEANAAPVNYTVIDSGLIRVTAPTNFVIRTKTEWQTFYKAATSHLFPQPTVPSVDFTKVTVVVVASGERATGGYQTLISGVTDELATATAPAFIKVQSLLINPGVGCFVSQSFTYPVAMFTVPRTTKPFAFGITSNAYKTCA